MQTGFIIAYILSRREAPLMGLSTETLLGYLHAPQSHDDKWGIACVRCVPTALSKAISSTKLLLDLKLAF